MTILHESETLFTLFIASTVKTVSFPLYHATSTLFTDSIKEFGLGGFNIIKEFKVIELLKELEDLADSRLGNHDDWRYIPKTEVSYITKQAILPGGNWQHGEVYLTPSLFTARNYSKNKYGSEAISITFKLIELLSTHNVFIDKVLTSRYSDLLKLKEMICEPVIYRLKNLPTYYMRCGEREEDLDSIIAMIMERMQKDGKSDYEGFVQQFNFRLARPIPWDILMS